MNTNVKEYSDILWKNKRGERNRPHMPTPEIGSVKINPVAGFASSDIFGDRADTYNISQALRNLTTIYQLGR